MIIACRVELFPDVLKQHRQSLPEGWQPGGENTHGEESQCSRYNEKSLQPGFIWSPRHIGRTWDNGNNNTENGDQ